MTDKKHERKIEKSQLKKHQANSVVHLESDDKENFASEIQTLDEMTENSIKAMKAANITVENLAKARAKNKLSNSRITSISRELRELIKVLSLYSY